MKTLSVKLPDAEYKALERAALEKERSLAQLVREVLRAYQDRSREKSEPRLTDLPLFEGRHPIGDLPSRAELYEDMWRAERHRQ